MERSRGKRFSNLLRIPIGVAIIEKVCRGRVVGEQGMFAILIVDNNVIFRNLLWETLNSNFPAVEVYQASSGEEAISMAKTKMPDLIFMDIELGGENGLNIVRQIKEDQPDITVAILTSYDLPEYKEAARRHKVDYFLTKGVSTQEDILSVVNAAYSARQA